MSNWISPDVIQLYGLPDDLIADKCARALAKQALGLIKHCDVLYECRQCEYKIDWLVKLPVAMRRMCTKCGHSKASHLRALREWGGQL